MFEIRISGFGGQGIIRCGLIIGKAASLYDGKSATLTQSFGPEARGSACSAQVVIDEERVLYPYITVPHILVAMSQEAYSKFSSNLKEGGTLLIDTDLVKPDQKKDLPTKTRKKISEVLDKMIGTRAAYIFDVDMKLQGKIPLNQFTEKNKRLNQAQIVVIDGAIDTKILNAAESHSIKFLVANSSKKGIKPRLLKIYTKNDLTD